eukprot:TRINITY_DN3038_c0_g4_i1.p1 TRINITY_DN3038_c0_g4~~TRINITY_DN3038_c0_g4_i1.p1  ORF type:complete len:405 (+),score=21.77 TRINITY_DN3038_c0_g4_i1:197-1411(+)
MIRYQSKAESVQTSNLISNLTVHRPILLVLISLGNSHGGNLYQGFPQPGHTNPSYHQQQGFYQPVYQHPGQLYPGYPNHQGHYGFQGINLGNSQLEQGQMYNPSIVSIARPHEQERSRLSGDNSPGYRNGYRNGSRTRFDSEEDKKHKHCFGLLDDRDEDYRCKQFMYIVCCPIIIPCVIVQLCWDKVLTPCCQKIAECCEAAIDACCNAIAKVCNAICECIGAVVSFFCKILMKICTYIFQAISWICSQIWKVIKPCYDALVKCLNATLVPLCEAIAKLISQCCAAIGRITAKICNIICDIFGAVYKLVASCCSWCYRTFIRPVCNAIGTCLKTIWKYVLKPVFVCIGAVLTVIFKAIAAVAKCISDIISKIYRFFYNLLAPIGRAISKCVQDARRGLRNLFR